MNPPDEQEKTRQHFEDNSEYWQEIYSDAASYTGYNLRKRQKFVIDLISERLASGTMVLDVGCGAGSAAIELAANGYQAAGIDFAPKMIERARMAAELRGLEVDFRVGSAEHIEFPDSHFDAVIALGMLASLPDDRKALAEMHRVLKPQGWLVVTLPNLLALDRWLGLPRSLPILVPTRMRPWLRRFGNLLRPLIGKPAKSIADIRYGRSGIPSSYARHLQRSGFTEVRYAAVTYGPIMPLGFDFIPQRNLINISESLGHTLPDWMGSVIVFYGQRA